MIKLFNKKAHKFSILALAVLLIIGAAVLTDAKVSAIKNNNITIKDNTSAIKKRKAVNVDKIDYPFVNDPDIIGRWQGVDYVHNTEDFQVDNKQYKGDLYIKDLNFVSGGKVSKTVFTWTKGHIIDPYDSTDSSYEIKNINGSIYMFFQWKNGDYTYGGSKPHYYVLKKISSTPSLTTNISGQEVQIRTDKIDYPFINDPEIIGKWKSIDFIKNIDDFNPNFQQWRGDLYAGDLTFEKNGIISNTKITWTKGLILNKSIKTASKYIIKNISGSKYMFFEFKNNDYVENGVTPRYYVLKQVK